MKIKDIGQIEDLLNDIDYPASKERIVEHAHRTGPGTEAERALAALPLGDYDNLDEVLRSVTLDPDPGRSAAERDYQRTHHRKAGLAEHMRDTERPPVEDELRRDRWGR